MPTAPGLIHGDDSCECNVSYLLKLAIDLIDPPSSPLAHLQNENYVVKVGDGECIGVMNDNVGEVDESAQDLRPLALPIPLSSNEASPTSKTVKKVRFSDTCSSPKTISVEDAIRAFDLLMHAASLSSNFSAKKDREISTRHQKHDETTMDANTQTINDATISINECSDFRWERLQHMADIYRALLITSCLLLELLPQSSASSKLSDSTNRNSSMTCTKMKCPLLSTSPPLIPALSPNIKKGILATARRCILLLQSLEKICAALTITR